MQISTLLAATPSSFGQFMCDAHILTGDITMPALISFVREQKRINKDHSILCTLDQLGQALYTMGHTTLFHDLDENEGHDLSHLSPSRFEEGEHIGALETKEEFPIRLSNFKKAASDTTLRHIRTKLDGLQLDSPECDFVRLNMAGGVNLDKTILVQTVPVRLAADALAAFPNGYFADDLSPFDNHVLAHNLQKEFEYELFGVGASVLGFLREHPLSVSDAHTVIGYLDELFAGATPYEVKQRAAATIAGQETLFFKYTLG